MIVLKVPTLDGIIEISTRSSVRRPEIILYWDMQEIFLNQCKENAEDICVNECDLPYHLAK